MFVNDKPARARARSEPEHDFSSLQALPKGWCEPCSRWTYRSSRALPAMRFCPTGGITADSAPRYLALTSVICVGGSWLAPTAAIRSGAWSVVEQHTREAVSLSGPARVDRPRHAAASAPENTAKLKIR